MAFKTQKYELVELVIPGVPAGQTGTRWNFPDLPKLRYTSLQAIETFTQSDIQVSPLQNQVVNLPILANTYIVFYLNERQDVYRVPLISLHRVQNGNQDPFVRSIFEFTGQKVTWDKTYLEMSQAPNNAVNQSFLFGVYYS